MKRIIKYIFKYKKLVFIPFVAMLVSIGLDMINPYLSKLMVDRVIKNSEINLMPYILLGIAGITLSRAALGYIREFTFDYLSSSVNTDLKRDLFNHIQSLPFSYFDNMNTGELMSRISEDVDNIWRAIAFAIGLFIENIIYFVVASLILFYLNWKLALFSIITMPVIGYIAIKLEKHIGEAYEKLSDQGAVVNTTAQENIAGVRLVKAFAREKHEIIKFMDLNKQSYKLALEQNRVWGKYFPVIEFLSNVSAVLVVAVGGIYVIKAEMTVGTLVAFNLYIWMLIWPMRMMGWLTNLIAQSSASAKKIDNIMGIEPEIKDEADALEVEKIRGHIKFENVSFKYKDEYVLKNITLEAKPGSTIAIMGTTGSGKTTLVSLIGRFYDVSSGRVTVDGYDVRDLKLSCLRGSMAVVAQDTFLFSESIEDNIKLGNEKASDYEIISASRDACAHEFISELEQGYETVIGERGIGLSGGQKQRISIARALIKDASILILDDSTSALDMDTEYELLKNLHQREKKVTTFIIAHRISAVKNADEILFLDNGKIIERGTHQELFDKGGSYYEVYCEQFKDFEDLEGEVV